MTTTRLVPGTLLDFLRSRTTGPAPEDELRPVRDAGDLHDTDLDWGDSDPADIDAGLMERLQEMYASALPGRLAAIARGTRTGNPAAVASAAQDLAGTSGQLGHPEVASICREIARDARRGVLAHGRLAELRALTRD